MNLNLHTNRKIAKAAVAYALCVATLSACHHESDEGNSHLPMRGAQQANETAAPHLVGEIAISASTEHSITLELTTVELAIVSATYDTERWEKDASTNSFATEHTLVLDRLMAGDSATAELTLQDQFANTTPLPELVVDPLSAEASTLPAPWASLDIGAVRDTLAGSASYREDDGVWFIRGTGTDVYWNADSFHFVYAPVQGDFELTLRVDGYYGYLHQWTKAMTMFRAGTEFDAAMFNQSLNYEGRDYLYYRASEGALHTDVTDSQLHSEAGAPLWGRLLRRGNTFTVYTSLDGERWTVHGPADGTTVALPTAGFVGFGVCSKSNEYLSEIAYSNVTLAICGDGIVAGSERCDDANTADEDECPSDCRGEATCGDGVVDPGEGCDDANELDGDGCSSCEPDPLCGDGVIDRLEDCDDGNSVDNDGCTACAIDDSCGDAQRDDGEECDDGNTALGDGCENCQRAHFCGDGQLDDGEQCDDGNDSEDDACVGCRAISFCGDGVVGEGEACDDHNIVDGDGCSADCEEEPPALDRDRDGVADAVDNCPDVSNGEQADLDRDGDGDPCDEDRDGDGLENTLEDRDADNTVNANETDPDDADSDDDGLCDGFAALPIVDADGAAVCRSGEDVDSNGSQDPGETDPRLTDSDGDCVSDGDERFGDEPSDPLDGDDPANGCGEGPIEPSRDAGMDAGPDATPRDSAGASPFGAPVRQEGLVGCVATPTGVPWSAFAQALLLLSGFVSTRRRQRR
ncbi:MAG: cysteine-rich repeat protein [Bradymonadia bacterium]|jgi:cysteine-rich repeat protein